jgi:predicted nucleotidyltransferase
MGLSNIRDGELREVFDALEEAFAANGTDYYIIGALAKDLWYSKGGKFMRQTKDVDFAVLVGSQQDYENIREYLKKHKDFQASKGNSFVMLSPNGAQVDILPFGEIEIDDAVELAGDGLTKIWVNGFREVYDGGTEPVELGTGHRFEAATLPSIVLLKLIAFDDRPDERDNDPGDIADIIDHFFDLKADLIYEQHSDLFEEDAEKYTLEQISASVIGREMKAIIGGNENLLDRIKTILAGHIQRKEEGLFIRLMTAENGNTVEENVEFLQRMLEGLQ